jgi:hypothetical protein
VISPLLANIYLHYSLDLWAERWRRREATGDICGRCGPQGKETNLLDTATCEAYEERKFQFQKYQQDMEAALATILKPSASS